MVTFIGFGELVLIVLVALLILGPHSLLALARLLGQVYHSFNRFMMELRSEISLSDIEQKPKTEKPEDDPFPPAG